MGTFDSIYQQKIRQLEEENRQLKNLINEAGIGGFGLSSAASAAARALKGKRREPRDNNIPINRKPPQGTPAPTGGAGGTPLVPKPYQMNPPNPTMIPQPLYPGYETFPVAIPGLGNIPIPVQMPGTQP